MHLMNDAHIVDVSWCQQSEAVVAVMVVANVRVATDLMSLLPNILWLSTTSSGLPSQH